MNTSTLRKIVLRFKSANQRIRNLLGSIKLKEPEACFVRHNRRIWGDFVQGSGDGQILVEGYKVAAGIISFSYLANVLAKKHNATIMVYDRSDDRTSTRIHRWVRNRIYKSFNASLFSSKPSESQLSEAEELCARIYPELKSKEDVIALKVDGTWLGDLIYDSYLMKFNVPTVMIEDIRFQSLLRDALSRYVFWRDYFDSHSVKGVIVSHGVYYEKATILRIATQRQIPVYQVNAVSIYYLTSERLWAYTDFYDYPRQFKELPVEAQEDGLRRAKERMARRFAGEVGVDMAYSTKSAFTEKSDKRVLQENGRIKVFIAAHCFFDAVHAYGLGLFPDFYEWLTFLSDISQRTDYDWYIKTHPDYLPGNSEILHDIICRYPKFTLIPCETSHFQIIDEGIDFALTVHGTIGLEYAALGIPVINASMCNPYVAYDFNIHPATIEEYESILLNLADVKIDIDINKVYEYYYMHFVDRWTSWFAEDFIDKIGGYPKQKDPRCYQVLIEQFSEQRHDKILQSLEEFVDSKDFCLRNRIPAIRRSYDCLEKSV